MFDAYDAVLSKVKPPLALTTPDASRGQPFTVTAVDAEGVTVKTSKGGTLRIGLFTFETAAKYLADNGVRAPGGKWLEVKDADFQMLLNMENDRVRAASYVLAVMKAAGLIEIDGGRPNKVRLL